MAKTQAISAESKSDAQGPTPDNTPLPGGGSWRWDITKPGWVERDLHTGDDVPEPAATDAATAATPE